MQPFMKNNSIRYDEVRTENQGVEKYCFGISG